MNTLTVSDSSPRGVSSDARNLGCCLLQITEVRHVMLCYTSKNLPFPSNRSPYYI